MLYFLVSLLIILFVLDIVVVMACCKVSGNISRAEERIEQEKDNK